MDRDASSPKTRSGTTMRLIALIGVLACELLAVYSLRALGWNETGDVLALLLAGAIALLPLFAAIGVLFLRGRRFSLKSMLIATTLMAIFISVVLYPFVQVQNRRRGVMVLESRGMRYGTVSQLKSFYEQLGIEYRHPPVAQTQKSDDIQFWMMPLLGDSMPVYPDRAVRMIQLVTDEDIEAVRGMGKQFPNLERIQVGLKSPTSQEGVTKDGLRALAKSCPKVEELFLTVSKMPTEWSESFETVRSLNLRGDWRWPHIKLKEEDVAEIASLPGLEILVVDRFDINDENVELLLEPPGLKHLTVWRSTVTDDCQVDLRRRYPDVDFRFGPYDPSPEGFLVAVSPFDVKMPFRVVYNESRAEWGRRVLVNPDRFEYYGIGWEKIDTDYPIVVEFEVPPIDDPVFVAKAMMRLQRLAARKGLSVESVQEDSDGARVVFVADPSAK